jgi:hypothetical protein
VIDTIYVASVYDGVYIEHMEATPMTVNAIDIEVRKPMWVVEVFSTRRNAWEQDGGDSAYSNT